MPIPVSATRMSTWSPRFPAVNSAPPVLVYRSALATIFCMVRLSIVGSDQTESPVSLTRNSRFLTCAMGWKSDAIDSNKLSKETVCHCGLTSPASSLDIYNKFLKSVSMVSKECSTCWQSLLPSSLLCTLLRVDISNKAALSGCNTSWLAAARKRVLDKLAVSAASFAVMSCKFDRSRSASVLLSSAVLRLTCSSRLIAVWNNE